MIETMTASEAAVLLKSEGFPISPALIRAGVKQRMFPFGICIETEKSKNECRIFKKLLLDWIAERSAQK